MMCGVQDLRSTGPTQETSATPDHHADRAAPTGQNMS